MIYLISYDANGQKDSTAFVTHLKRSHPESTRITASEFLMESDAAALTLLVDLSRHLGPEGRLLVSEVTQNLGWHNLRIEEDAMERWEGKARDCG